MSINRDQVANITIGVLLVAIAFVAVYAFSTAPPAGVQSEITTAEDDQRGPIKNVFTKSMATLLMTNAQRLGALEVETQILRESSWQIAKAETATLRFSRRLENIEAKNKRLESDVLQLQAEIRVLLRGVE